MVDSLIVDCYQPDGPKDWKTFIAAGEPWIGAVFKLTQGTYFEESTWAAIQRTFFTQHERYGITLFDGFYHYLDLSQDGALQAEWFWKQMIRIGGERKGTLWGMVDVERGGQRVVPSAQRVFDITTAFANRYKELSGRLATLYGGELLRSLNIHGPGAAINLLGCGRNSIALYGPTLPEQVVKATGTDEAHLFTWQYDGDGEAYLHGYPSEAPGCGKIDISVLTIPGKLPGLVAALAA